MSYIYDLCLRFPASFNDAPLVLLLVHHTPRLSPLLLHFLCRPCLIYLFPKIPPKRLFQPPPHLHHRLLPRRDSRSPFRRDEFVDE
jgi:hypothetical protein